LFGAGIMEPMVCGEFHDELGTGFWKGTSD